MEGIMNPVDLLAGFIVGFLASLLAAWALEAIRDSSKRGRIIRPASGSEVDSKEVFYGTCNVKGRYRVYLAVKPIDSNNIYPQVNQGPLSSEWRSDAYFGDEDSNYGERFKLLLVAVDDEAEVVFDLYRKLGNATKNWGGLPKLPRKSLLLDTVEVIRKQKIDQNEAA